jgi:plasmid stability protein
MTTSLNLPDDLATAVKQRAAEGGRGVAEEVVELVRKGLAVSGHPAPAANLARPVISKEPVTGLPVIQGAPNAPISRMTADEIQSMIDQSQLEEDPQRIV